MTTQTTRLADGDSYSWEFPTGAVTDVAVSTSQQPVDVDIEEKLPGEPDSEYSRVEQLSTFFSGPKTVTETGTKTLTIPTDGVVIRVTVTNNSGSPVTPQVSVTPADQREIFYEDGKAMVDAQEALVEQLDVSELAAALDAAGYDITGIGNAEAESVSTESAAITNETLLDVRSNSDKTNISSGQFDSPEFDDVLKDERGEFDTSTNEFTPTDDGYYLVTALVLISPGADQDKLSLRFRDTTANDSLVEDQDLANTSQNQNVALTTVLELVGGNAHELQAADNNNNFDIVGASRTTYLQIRQMFR